MSAAVRSLDIFRSAAFSGQSSPSRLPSEYGLKLTRKSTQTNRPSRANSGYPPCIERMSCSARKVPLAFRYMVRRGCGDVIERSVRPCGIGFRRTMWLGSHRLPCPGMEPFTMAGVTRKLKVFHGFPHSLPQLTCRYPPFRLTDSQVRLAAAP
jgi:hypothetical protein